MAAGGEDDNDHGWRAIEWIRLRGDPMWNDVQGILKLLWTIGGGGVVVGVILTLFGAYILRKLGFPGV